MLDKEVDLRPDVDGKVFLLNTSAALQVNHRREGTLRLAFLSDNGTIIRIKPKKPTVASLPIESGRFDILYSCSHCCLSATGFGDHRRTRRYWSSR